MVLNEPTAWKDWLHKMGLASESIEGRYEVVEELMKLAVGKDPEEESILSGGTNAIENQTKWVKAATKLPLVFTVPATRGGKIAILHHCEMLKDKFVGICGFAASAPFKAFKVSKAFGPLVAPRSFKKPIGEEKVPTVKQIVRAVAEREPLDKIEGRSEKSISDFEKVPAISVWHPPALDVVKESRGEADAMGTLQGVTEWLIGSHENAEEAEPVWEAALQKLWVVGKIYSTKVTVADPAASIYLEGLATKARKELLDMEAYGSRDQAERGDQGESEPKESAPDDRALGSDIESEAGRRAFERDLERAKRESHRLVAEQGWESEEEKEEDGLSNSGREEERKESESETYSSAEERTKSRGEDRTPVENRKRKERPSKSGKGSPGDSGGDSSSEASSDLSSIGRKNSGSEGSGDQGSDSDDESLGGGSTDSSDSSQGKRNRRKKIHKTAVKNIAKKKKTDPNNPNWWMAGMAVEALTMLKHQARRQEKREAKKNSLTEKWGVQSRALFRLLSARKWSEKGVPSYGPNAKKILKEKQLTGSLDTLLQTIAEKGWVGRPTRSGLTEFWGRGFLAENTMVAPGGFTVFMCKPGFDSEIMETEQRKQNIQSKFGDGKLSDETLKTLVKKDWHFPENYYEALQQLKLAEQLLDLLTRERGIASEGFRFAAGLMERRGGAFFTADSADESGLFYVKYLTLVDRTFQSFCRILSSYAGSKDPVRKAAKELRGFQKGEIDDTMWRVLNQGLMLTITLPSKLRPGGGGKNRGGANMEQGGGGKQPGKKRADEAQQKKPQREQGPEWYKRNPSVNLDWALPRGKRFGDFFNRNLRANSAGFPKAEHHKSKKPTYLCLAYQARGECFEGGECKYAHVPADQFGEEDKAAINKRFEEIYSS